MMKIKSASSGQGGEVTLDQLEKINQHTRRELTPEEVYVFPVILCDNEVDRDLERFPLASLEALGPLFLGKSGIFDHNPKTESQKARIFDTQVAVSPDRSNSVGEDYAVLRAWAYMLRSQGNAELIGEIDGGIKKEVSVGCSVEQVLCSICGERPGGEACTHQKGQRYGGDLCHHLLVNPTDAYEWSFVAVPAQMTAGVTKRRGEEASEMGVHRLEKWFAQAGEADVILSREEFRELGKSFDHLKALAGMGEAYLQELRRKAVKALLLAQPDLDPILVESVAAKMNEGELKAFAQAFRKTAGKRFPLGLQTEKGGENTDGGSISQFKI